jgi:hypothetical protein
MKDEPDSSYARFLMYRNMGPTRSYLRVYHSYLKTQDGFTGGIERLNIPGSWLRQASKWQWRKRAVAWDISKLETLGSRVAVAHSHAILSLAVRNLANVRKYRPGDDEFADVVKALQLVASYFTPELTKGLKDGRLSSVKSLAPVRRIREDGGD